MRCSNCGTEGISGKRFCAECGSPLPNRCPNCDSDNTAGAKFCVDCGQPLTTPAGLNAPAPPVATHAVAGERRHLTILFCDLVGSTTLAAQLDPEEWRATVAGYQRAASDAITRFDGAVVRYVGDGIMAFFGYPVAHDNDAERAARAGLVIVDAIAQLNEQSSRTKLAVRIGIDSGHVVVGRGAGNLVDAFGDTANIAARVQAAADPGAVVVTGETHRLISGLFVVEDRGPHTLKGIAREITLYHVIQPSGIRGRFEAMTAAGGLTPFVGREEELRLLFSRWEQTCDGEGQAVAIVGEAGIGKSRLLQRFRAELSATPYTWLECATAPFFQNTPFYAAGRSSFHWSIGQSAEERLSALEASLVSAGLDPKVAVPLIAPFLELPPGDKYPPLALPPDQQRKRLLATLVDWAFGAARVRALVIAIEDLHWVDPSTLELIQLLVEQGATAPLLLLYTARPEFHPPWLPRAHHTQITLNRLSARNVRAMVAQVAASKALSDDTVATVVERTGGVPLFVEELTRAVLESGDPKLTGHEIPATLRDSLMARLDRLGPARVVIQIGAVLGGDFSYELLHAVHPLPEPNLQRALSILTDAELLYVRGLAPEATYQFKHALIRDAAYEALLKSRRKDLHLIVARTIDEKFPALKDAHPELLAHHWTEAGEIEPAIAEWIRAGKATEARSAFEEAQGSYQHALSLLNTLPESPNRDSRELEYRQSLVRMLFITKGYIAPETITATERSAALAEKSGNLRQLVNLLIARGLSAVIAGEDLLSVSEMAERALGLARREASPSGLGRALMLQLMVRFYRGDLANAEKNFEEGLRCFDHPGFRRVPGVAVAAFNYGSWNAWVLGRSDIARDRMARMLAAANRENPYEMMFAEHFAAQLLSWMREYEQAESLATRALELGEKHQFVEQSEFTRCVLGHARVQLGRTAEGIALIRAGIRGLREIGATVESGDFTGWLASAQERDGAIIDALETIELALEANPAHYVHRPETLRVRGELRLKHGQTELGEADFRQAIALAQSMSAKAWQMRSTLSLARLLRDTGRRDEGCAMLAEIYNWFTEGFDTADLKDAKALLDELNEPPQQRRGGP